jgi:hypothetical protein
MQGPTSIPLSTGFGAELIDLIFPSINADGNYPLLKIVNTPLELWAICLSFYHLKADLVL